MHPPVPASGAEKGGQEPASSTQQQPSSSTQQQPSSSTQQQPAAAAAAAIQQHNNMTRAVWCQLRRDGVDVGSPSRVQVPTTNALVDDVRDAIKVECSNALKDVDAADLNVYAAGTADPSNSKPLDPGLTPLPDTTGATPLIVVAPPGVADRRKRSSSGGLVGAPEVKRIRANKPLKVQSRKCVDLAVDKLAVLTQERSDTVRYYGRDGVSEMFNDLVDSQEDKKLFNVALVGPPGTGKSNLVWAAAEYIAGKKRQTVLWASACYSGAEWIVRLFKPKPTEGNDADAGDVLELTNCPGSMEEILNHEVAENAEVVILDAVMRLNDPKTSSDGNAAFKWAGVQTRTGSRRVIHVTSLGSFAQKQVNRVYLNIKEIEMRPWTRQDFVEAVDDDKLKRQVSKTLDIDDPSGLSSDEVVDRKFFFSGTNARWFFNFSVSDIKEECKGIVSRLPSDPMNVGEKHEMAVNSVFQTYWDGDRCVKLFTSCYLAHLMGTENCIATKFLEYFPLIKDRLGNGSPGEIFETDFATHLQHSHDLAAAQRDVMGLKAQKVYVRLGVDCSTKRTVMWPTGQLLSLPKAPKDTSALQPMPSHSPTAEGRVTLWFIPEDPSHPFLDFFALIPVDEGKWQFRAVQNTVSNTHSADMEQLKRIVGGVLNAEYDLADRLVVAFVIEDGEKQKTVGSDIEGTSIEVNNPKSTVRSSGTTPIFKFSIDLLRVVYTRTGAHPR